MPRPRWSRARPSAPGRGRRRARLAAPRDARTPTTWRRASGTRPAPKARRDIRGASSSRLLQQGIGHRLEVPQVRAGFRPLARGREAEYADARLAREHFGVLAGVIRLLDEDRRLLGADGFRELREVPRRGRN